MGALKDTGGTSQVEEFFRYLHLGIDKSIDPKKVIVMQIEEGVEEEKKKVTTKSYRTVGAVEHLIEWVGKKDIYITPNQFLGHRRNQETLWELNNLYVDLDIETKTDMTVEEVYFMLLILIENEVIPEPTMIVMSGRGLHLYWNIGSYVPTENNKKLWLEINTQLALMLKDFGADVGVSKDIVRVLRMPQSVNSRNDKICELMFVKRNTYSMLELVEKYFKDIIILPKLVQPLKVKEPKEFVKKERPKYRSKIILDDVKTYYTLHVDRINDFKKLIELREFDIKGYRNNILFLIAYYSVITHDYDIDNLVRVVNQINKILKEPLCIQDIRIICKSANKYKDRYTEYFNYKRSLNYENLKEEETNKLIGLEKGILKYSNKKLMEILNIAEQEQQKLKTLINKDIKADRLNSKKREKRRNKNGLTTKEQKKKDTQESIQSLKNQNHTQKQVSEMLGISIRTVKSYWNINI